MAKKGIERRLNCLEEQREGDAGLLVRIGGDPEDPDYEPDLVIRPSVREDDD